MSSSDAIDHGRFAPGTLLDGRYRIVGRLGKGGMGEVYRADDLKLGQPVALKFLPEAVDRDPARLTQLHTEVRMARQVSHPNVCRVYDVGEVEGHTFLSMEYVDGEDLASLLRRIGRFPQDRAIELARQICAGLAAAHDRGVVHRDLKPANIMLDGSGQIRITDFGLAGVTGRNAARRHAGLHGARAARRRRGHAAQRHLRARPGALRAVHRPARARRGATMAELIAQARAGRASRLPTDIVRDLDPAIERVDHALPASRIRRARPASALAVAAALPGGDPLAAALAAGETPSPEMVAAAGLDGSAWRSHRDRIAVAWIVDRADGACSFIYQRVLLINIVPLPKPPAALADRAQEICAEARSRRPAVARPPRVSRSRSTGPVTSPATTTRARAMEQAADDAA